MKDSTFNQDGDSAGGLDLVSEWIGRVWKLLRIGGAGALPGVKPSKDRRRRRRGADSRTSPCQGQSGTEQSGSSCSSSEEEMEIHEEKSDADPQEKKEKSLPPAMEKSPRPVSPSSVQISEEFIFTHHVDIIQAITTRNTMGSWAQALRCHKEDSEESKQMRAEVARLSLSDEQAVQFAAEENTKILWDKIKSTSTGKAEDRKIDAANKLKNLQMKSNESANDYVVRARGIATKNHSLGLDVTPRELVYYRVRRLKGKYSKVREIFNTQRDKSMDEILEILREEEITCYSPTSTRPLGSALF
ncbi:hypothetical protein HNY73_007816 [Argiope bruennichi]|uniref:Uncharacterized protein n=1 Tax=Argiope bruennichi TaxID=94029 RepID=A0A8T0FF57_ARGBR|nr:hypothetical protein HNY73_007816 [Argiope bruennichi]